MGAAGARATQEQIAELTRVTVLALERHSLACLANAFGKQPCEIRNWRARHEYSRWMDKMTDLSVDDSRTNDPRCHTCDGDGWGIVGADWDSDDPINGPYDGEIEKCPNCHGTGLEKDCWFW